MAKTRIELNEKLKEICNNVYYQPPQDFQIKYPCIVYTPNYTDVKYANNRAYKKERSWNITYITRGADDSVEDKMLDTFMHVKLTNNHVVDGLYQETYRVYF